MSLEREEESESSGTATSLASCISRVPSLEAAHSSSRVMRRDLPIRIPVMVDWTCGWEDVGSWKRNLVGKIIAALRASETQVQLLETSLAYRLLPTKPFSPPVSQLTGSASSFNHTRQINQMAMKIFHGIERRKGYSSGTERQTRGN